MVSGLNAIRWDFAAHKRHGADDAAAAQDRAVQQHAVAPDPDIILDEDAALAGKKLLFADEFIFIMKGVIGRREHAIRPDADHIAHGDAVASIKHATGIDDDAFADDHVPRSA